MKIRLLAIGMFLAGLVCLAQAQFNGCQAGFCSKVTTSVSGPISFVAGTNAGSSDITNVTTSAIDTTGANFIVLNISILDFFPSGTITDSKGNSSPTPLTAASGGGFCRSRLFYYVAPTVGSGHTFTFTGGAAGEPSIGVAAFSGVAASPFDVENGAGGTSASPSAGSITPTLNGELVFAGVCTRITTINSIDSSFNVVGTPIADDGTNHLSEGIAYLIQNTAAAVNPTWTTGGSQIWAATIASFKKQ